MKSKGCWSTDNLYVSEKLSLVASPGNNLICYYTDWRYLFDILIIQIIDSRFVYAFGILGVLHDVYQVFVAE